MGDSLFTVLGEGRFRATERSRGPWDPRALHGGPVAALVAHCAQRALQSTGSPAVHPVRLTLDLERPVPMTPIRVDAQIVRPGGKLQVVEVVISDDGDTAGRRLARASVLALRHTGTNLPANRPEPDDDPPPPPSAGKHRPVTLDVTGALPAYHSHGTEHLFVDGTFREQGPATVWIRLLQPVVPEAPLTPFERVCAAADFVNGMSTVLPWEEWTFINPDLTVTLHRAPVGEWICLDAGTRLDEHGVGTAEADLFDERGRIGRAVQTLLIEHR